MPTANYQPDSATIHPSGSSAMNVTVWSGSALAGWLLPLLLVLVVVGTSPNFDVSQTVRSSPLGSDFLQDWVGATIVASSDRALLYDSGHYQALQHDTNIVGFEWPANQYYPMVYPPFFYSLLRPLANMSYQSALWCWMLMLALALGTSFTIVRHFEPTRGMFGVFVAASLLFAPLLFSLNMAHKSVLLLLIFTATYVQLYRQRHFTAGVIFGLLLFKPHLAILVGITMLLKRQWSFVLGTGLTVALLLLSSIACGSDLCWNYFEQTLTMGQYTQHGGYRLSEAVNLNAVAQLAAGTGLVAWSITVCSSAIVLGMLWFAMQGPIRTNSKRFATQFSMLLLAVPLLSPHFYIYDLTIMLLPLLLMACEASNQLANDQDVRAALKWQSGVTKFLAAPRVMLYWIAGFIFLAGFFSKVAAATYVQPAAILLIGLLVLASFNKSCRVCSRVDAAARFGA